MLQAFAENHTRFAWNKFMLWWNPLKHKPMPKVIINRRLKTMAGYAYFLPNELHLCEELLSQYKKEFAEQIIPHEVCHFVCWHRWQDTKHSPAWKAAMSANGYAPERLHYLVNHKHEERKLARMAGL